MSKDDDGKEEDCDELFLDQVLNKLYDFGDGPASKRKRTSQKKKSKKRCEVEEEEEEEASDDDARVMKASPEEPRGVGDTETGQSEPSNAAGTGSAPPLLPLVEVVTFQDPTKKPKTTRQTSAPETKTPQMKEKKKKKDPENPEDFSLEKARLEVHRFGITGYQKAQQRVFEQERAVMLGARPPKKEYVNYKVLQQTIKDKKQKVKEEVPTDLKKKKKSKPRDEKRKSSSGSAPTGQVGRFKNGMLVLNSKDIQKIKAKR